MSASLHMVQLRLKGRQLTKLRAGQAPSHWQDEGYKLHCILGELFGALAPGPFVLEQADEHGLTVLAYSTHDLAALQEGAQLEAAPNVYEVCDWEASASKPMPTSFRQGAMLGFEVRVCPVVRLGKSLSQERRERAGAELDVFVHKARTRIKEALAAGLITQEMVDDPYWEPSQHEASALDRGQVYAGWLAERLSKQGGARVVEATMDSFQLQALRRRTHEEGRAAHTMRRPDAVMRGTLEVLEPTLFAELLQRGVGRHCAFGFGMLKLKRAAPV